MVWGVILRADGSSKRFSHSLHSHNCAFVLKVVSDEEQCGQAIGEVTIKALNIFSNCTY